jgi:pyruvate dehydrogenase E1 component alpha subunit
VLQLRALAAEAVTRLRCGEGPAFIECRTYRWREHVGPNEDYEAGYRPRTALTPWLDNDQVGRVGAMLAADRREAIDTDVEREIADAIAFAETSPFPAIEALHTNVFAAH